ncbi:hypothetical protein [Deinococcus roseus]|uniref:Uncharacterized protein n=1 Tax=Deinococcus roseus TaxID=392414 RepID=A0ABQ2D885_9DEIO|nr:hypothetical protein [Deinococcus roseus]GGJ49267.1 hypothetical protein GCM10008938_39070 [Deinococcus roseus]
MKYVSLGILAVLALLLLMPLLEGPLVPFWVVLGLLCLHMAVLWFRAPTPQAKRALIIPTLLALGVTVYLAFNPPPPVER